MPHDSGDQDQYANDDPESFNQWFPLEHEHLEGSPFKLYFIKLKSDSDEARGFFMDPNNTLRGERGLLPALPGVDEATRITTTIVGHERTLLFRSIYAFASQDEQDNSVAIMSNKDARDPSG